jgi:D-amino peptidase
MKIYISVDIEGVAGVVTPNEGQPGNPEYEQARRLMTLEANAAIAGAFEGGAREILVNDSHGPMVNLLPELLDPRVELIRGNIKPFSMFAGLDGSYDGAMCVGYHAPAADYGVLAHTTNGFAFAAIRLNGELASEAMFYGAYAGAMGVPVILLSGDDVTERSCGSLFPGARFVRVKTALGQRAARSVAPSVACAAIREGAAEAVRRCGSVTPYRVAEPCRVEFELTSPTLADICGFVPGSQRLDARTVAFDCTTITDAIGWMNVCSSLSARLR